MARLYRRLYLIVLLAGLAACWSFEAKAQCAFTNLNSSYCVDDASVALTGGTNYYGPGITGSTFNPAAAGVGNHQLITTNGIAASYTVNTTGTFSPVAGTGTAVVLADNAISTDLPIGFSFNFFGTSQSTFRIVSNGYLRFAGTNFSATPQAVPSTTPPNQLIAFAWDDLNPAAGGTIEYFTIGSAPFRKLIMNFINVPFQLDNTKLVTSQVQLHETTNIIEIHTTRVDSDGTTRTMGIEDLNGTTGYVVPGRSNSNWTATNDFAQFRPTCLDIRTVTVNALPLDRTVTPANSTVCAGSSVNVTIASSEAGVSYQLQNNADGAPLSAFVNGTGANLVIPSNALTANTVIKVSARNNTTLCRRDLTDRPNITVNQSPTSNAGPDQTVCGTSATLAATAPGIGTGAWTVVAGAGGSFTASSSPTSVFNGVAGTTYTLRWTVSNAPCSPATDDVVIKLDQAPTPANAGPAQNICGTFTSLAANVPLIGTGQWSIISGTGGVLSDINSATSGFTGVAGNTYVLRWTTSNGACGAASTSDVTIQFFQSVTSNAGSDQAVCGTSATLAATAPGIGTGAWTVVSGAGGSFTASSSPTSVFNGVAGTTYTLRWTVSNAPCSPATDDVVITLDQSPTAANAGTAQNICGTFTSLAANVPIIGTGQWSIISGIGGVLSDINSATSGFTGVAGNTYVLRWTTSNGACVAASTSDVTIAFFQSVTSNAGSNQAVCGTSATLAATAPGIGTGAWTVVSGAGGSFTASSSPNSVFNGVAGTSYVLRWTVTNGPCTATSDVTITLDQSPTPANAGTAQNICGTFTSLAANVPLIGTGQWSIISGTGGVFSDVNSATSGFTGVAGNTYVLRWTTSNGACVAASTSDVTIAFFQSVTSNAGSNQAVCGSSATLAATTPGIGTGAWTVVSGSGGTFTASSSPTSVFNGTAGTSYVLRWTVTNGPCTATSDVTITLDQSPTAANAGTAQNICGTFTSLAANVPVIGTGQWSIISGTGGVLSDVNSATSGFTGVAGNSYVLRWTTSNGACSAASTSDVTITFFQSVTSNAGSNQAVCGTSATLAATAPGIGTGAWTVVSGAGGSFTASSSPTSVFNGVAGTSYVLRWTVTNGPCTATSDVTITLDQSPTPANAGTAQNICGTFTSLAANVPVIGTGQWSIISGTGGVLSDVNSATSGFTGVAGNSYVLRWTTSNGACVAASTSDVTIAFFQSVTSNAGSNQAVCGTSATLAATAPGIGTGAWTLISGVGGSFTASSSPTSVFNGTAGTTYVLRWTVTNGPCTATSDVTITLDQSPTAANAGTAQNICGTFTSLAANVPIIGTGQWSIISGIGGVLSDINSATSGFTGVAGNTYVLRWTTSNGACVAASTSDVTIAFFQSVTSNAGSNQAVCGTSATLAATAPGIGTGAWTLISGVGGSFTASSSPTSVFTGVAGTSYVLRWTVTNGPCTATSDVTITLDQSPTAANAGTAQNICGTFTSLAANVPVIGTGQWSIISGTGGVLSDINSATSGFTGVAGNTYVLRWTTSNGACVAASTSDVTIAFFQSVTSNAGSNQAVCGTSATLAATAPGIGTGAWTLISGVGGTFTAPSSPTSVFNGTAGTSYVLRWTVTNGPCTATSDVTITLDQSPTAANAGTAQNICGTFTSLAANVPVIGTGQWSIISGTGGVLSDINSATSGFTGVAGNSYVLRWTTSNGACVAASTSDVTIAFFQSVTSNAGSNQAVCGTSATLAATAPGIGTGAWTLISGVGGTFTTPSSPTSVFTGVAGTTYVLRWTVTNGPCTATSNVTITLDQSPTPANAGTAQNICGTFTSLAANVPVIGTGQWSIISGTGGVLSDINSATSGFTGVAGNTYVLRWTTSNGACVAASTSDVTIAFFQSVTSNAGSNQAVCGSSATLAATAPGIGTGAWTVVSGAGGSFTASSSPTSVFNGVAGTSYVLRWTVTNGPCTASSDVTITLDQSPTAANAGTAQNICGTFTSLAANVPVIGTGQWSVISGIGGVLSDINSATSGFTGVAGNTYVLRWTTSNGACVAASTSDVTIAFFQSVTSNAGSNQSVCGTSATLAATAPGIGTGAWTLISGVGGSFTASSSPTSVFNGVAGTTYVLRWTVTNGPCTATSDVTITLDQSPTAANAGTAQNICGTFTSLAANVPVIGTGQWSIISGTGGVLSDINSATSGFTGVAGNTYVLRWTTSNGACVAASTSDVTIAFFQLVTSNAGSNQVVCGTSATLAATTPGIGTGAWTVVSGSGGTFTASSSPTSVFNGTAGTSYVLRWTVTNGPCTATSDVTITLDQSPTAANAGTAQNICGTFTSLAANVPAIGTGQWSIISGTGGVLSDINSATSGFTGVAGNTYVLRWTTSNGACVAASTSDVTIHFDASPTISNAGPDQEVCGASTVLSGNTPSLGTGGWSIINGSGGSITSPGSAASAFTGVSGNMYTLRWTITNGVCSSVDDVVVVFKRIPDASASSAAICSGKSTSIAISNPNAVPGTTFNWSVTSVANVTGASAGSGNVISQLLTTTSISTSGTVQYQITPVANGCFGTPINITVTVSPVPLMTNTPTSLIQEICSGVTLNFSPTSTFDPSATYAWTSSVIGTLSGVSASGNGNIMDTPVNTTSSNAVIIYTITPSNGSCDGNPINFVVTVRPVPTVAAAGQSICSGQSTSITITNPNSVAGTTYSWAVQSMSNVSGAAPGSGNSISQQLINGDGLTNGTVTYRITPSVNGCQGPFIDVVVTVKPVPVMNNPTSSYSEQICSAVPLSFVPSTLMSGTTFTWTSAITGPISPGSVTAVGSGNITDAPVNTGNVSGTVVYTITPTNNGCPGAPVNFVVTVIPVPSATASNATICSGETVNIPVSASPKNVTGTTFIWTILSVNNLSGATPGSGTAINQTLSTVTASVGTVTYAITPSANGCEGPPTNVTVTVNPQVTVNAGADYAICENVSMPMSVPLSGTIGGSATNGSWLIKTGSGSVTSSTTSGATVTANYTAVAADVTRGFVELYLTSNDPDGGGPCVVKSDTVRINVNRRATITPALADQIVCEPQRISLSGTIGGSATAGSWSVVSGAGTLSVSSVTGNTISATYDTLKVDVGQTLVFRLATNDPDGSGPCTVTTDDVNITINESAKVSAGSNFYVCEDKPVNLQGSFSGATTSVQWTGGNGGSFTNANAAITDYNLTAADKLAGFVVFTLTTNDPAGVCPLVTSQVQVDVRAVPTIDFILDPSYAENDPIKTFFTSPPGSGSFPPAGGVFTGPGIIAGTRQFDPSAAGSGPVTITFTLTDVAGCTNAISKNTFVNPVTDIDFDIQAPGRQEAGVLKICENSGVGNLLLLQGDPPASSGFGNTRFTSSNPVLASHIVKAGAEYYINTAGLPGTPNGMPYYIEYIYTNSGNATDTLTKALVVFSAPRAVISIDKACVTDLVEFKDDSDVPNPTSGGVPKFWFWSYGDGTASDAPYPKNPTHLYQSFGTYNISLRVETDQGCSNTATGQIRVGRPPEVDFDFTKICSGDVTEFKDRSNPFISNITSYAWDFGDLNTTTFGAKNTSISGADTHGGKTSGVYNDPNHQYDEFKTYDVKLSVRTDDGCEAEKTKRVFILDYNAPSAQSAYFETFENGAGTWVRGDVGANNSWKFGLPEGDVINSAGPGSDTNAWWTGNNQGGGTNSTYYINEKSDVIGPCLDITSLKRPMISLDYWSDLERQHDGVVVQYSRDGGLSWETIGNAEGGGINWYETRDIIGAPGGLSNYAWSDNSRGWRTARFNLDQIPFASRDKVVFRVALGADPVNAGTREFNGFAFDNVYIGEKPKNVLVEQFNNYSGSNNDANDYIDALYDSQFPAPADIFGKTQSDFFKIDYHVATGGFDLLNSANQPDPAARALFYGVNSVPVALMDGIVGNYNGVNLTGNYGFINSTLIDRRALEDPKFDIKVDFAPGQTDTDPLDFEVTVKYVDSLATDRSVNDFDHSLIVHAVLLENGVTVDGRPEVYRNVMRKLLYGGTGYEINDKIWNKPDAVVIDRAPNIDVQINKPDSLYVAVFVQERLSTGPDARKVLQAVLVKAPAKVGKVIVGNEEEAALVEANDIQVYPNPASKFVNLRAEEPLRNEYVWKLIDQRGVTVASGKINRNLTIPQQIDVAELPNAIYFMEIGLPGQKLTYKKIAVMNKN